MQTALPTFPPLLATLLRKLPAWPHGVIGSLGLNLAQRAQVLPDLQCLEGRSFAIEIRDLGVLIPCRFEQGRFRPILSRAEPDVRFSAELADYWALIQREEDPDTLFFHRRLVIEGDTELGLTVKNLLDAMELPNLRAALWQLLKRPLG
ncbi:putative lipid carrier protein YhbT [Chitinivorax tropicus]|uniref:Ubiquinone biosynthesis accessory factor UbiT n=1 Tax=Chitinivorax tropicus TaxID=714531 RepID=A0A840ML99_9PROT|nr:SCP2 sterol-binding domain-containing protein [Chitinivorax tropicus]MBB5017657.1 putative lipid carrier protein YhbT [Chitinivorax tropicus]